MKKILYLLPAIIISATLFSQTTVKRALILNEGYFDYLTNEIITPVTIGAYDPVSGTYALINEVADARFASDLKIVGDYYYVAADKFLLKYDRYTDTLVNETEVQGIRKIGVDDSHIIVTRGEYLTPLDAYIQIYDMNSMELLSEVPAADLNFTTEGVEIKDGIAYVAVNNGFDFGNEVGYLATVNMSTGDLTGTIDLGADGINPDNLMIDGDNIYTLNNKDFTGSSISNYKIAAGDITTTNLLNISSGCGTSAFVNGSILYQEMFGTTISKFDPATLTITDETDYGTSFYALTYDGINDLLYTSETDYFSYGKINIFDASGALVTNFDASISPGNIALDVREATGVETIAPVIISCYPNPTQSQLHVVAPIAIKGIKISTVEGKIMYTSNSVESNSTTVEMSAFPAGSYIISIITPDAVTTKVIEKNN